MERFDGLRGSKMNLAYHWYEAAHAGLRPTRWAMDAMRLAFSNPINPLSYTPHGRTAAAACELFGRTTSRYAKPAFGLDTTVVAGDRVPVRERVVWVRPFCRLSTSTEGRAWPGWGSPSCSSWRRCRGTMPRSCAARWRPSCQTMTSITDWVDARRVPASQGAFDLDSYIDYLVAMLRELSPNLHVLAVCQSAVPVLAAVALLEAEQDPSPPLSMTLIGGPIDTRRSPTRVNQLAQECGSDWFRHNCIVQVPFPHPGFGRDVYPGFLAALRLHGDEYWSACRYALEDVPASHRGRRRLGGQAARIL